LLLKWEHKKERGLIVSVEKQPGAAAIASHPFSKSNQGTNSHLAADTENIDSLGNSKSDAPVGPRGPSAPKDSRKAVVGAKAPPKPKVEKVKTAADDKDAAGNPKHAGHEHTNHLGPRGVHSVRDTYKI
jgi:hypothetical protein